MVCQVPRGILDEMVWLELQDQSERWDYLVHQDWMVIAAQMELIDFQEQMACQDRREIGDLMELMVCQEPREILD